MLLPLGAIRLQSIDPSRHALNTVHYRVQLGQQLVQNLALVFFVGASLGVRVFDRLIDLGGPLQFRIISHLLFPSSIRFALELEWCLPIVGLRYFDADLSVACPHAFVAFRGID
jgi:hypothetical protein